MVKAYTTSSVGTYVYKYSSGYSLRASFPPKNQHRKALISLRFSKKFTLIYSKKFFGLLVQNKPARLHAELRGKTMWVSKARS